MTRSEKESREKTQIASTRMVHWTRKSLSLKPTKGLLRYRQNSQSQSRKVTLTIGVSQLGFKKVNKGDDEENLLKNGKSPQKRYYFSYFFLKTGIILANYLGSNLNISAKMATSISLK